VTITRRIPLMVDNSAPNLARQRREKAETRRPTRLPVLRSGRTLSQLPVDSSERGYDLEHETRTDAKDSVTFHLPRGRERPQG